MNKKLITKVEDLIEDYDLCWNEECYTISKHTWIKEIKPILKGLE